MNTTQKNMSIITDVLLSIDSILQN